MPKVLVIDNFDSFTYNLVHLLEGINAEVTVVRNDDLEMINPNSFEHILISPGPGLPEQLSEVKNFVTPHFTKKNILGVCLGHQLLGEVFGAKLFQNNKVYHGIASRIEVNNASHLFKNLPKNFNVGRYHSWMVNALPKEFMVTATDKYGNVMAFEHNTYKLFGVQFHPESILTEYGREMLRNWLK